MPSKNATPPHGSLVPLLGGAWEKRRPALVVSHRNLAQQLGRVRVAMITSVPGTKLGDMPIADLAAAGLPVASTLRASKVAMRDAGRIIRVAGRLSEADQSPA